MEVLEQIVKKKIHKNCDTFKDSSGKDYVKSNQDYDN